jgi:MFS family permease
MKATFSAFRNFNYRLWAAGSLVSNIGTWFQRIAQDWLVLTEMTSHDAAAVGIVMALQTGPTLLLLPLTGYAADHFDRRRLLIVAQAAMGVLALALGLLVISGVAKLWHVYVFAFLFGCVSAFEMPARQTFGRELVGEEGLAKVVSMNAMIFNLARMIGPAIAGLLIAVLGTGWGFIANAASFGASLLALIFMRVHALHRTGRAGARRGGFADGLRYVLKRPDLRAVILMTFLVGTFGLNFPIFISTMSVSIFHGDADQYGFFMAIMAIGSIAGALLAGSWDRPELVHLLATAMIFACGFAMAAMAPTIWTFGFALVVLGAASVGFTTTTSSFAQLATEPTMRGRVMAIRLAVGLGGTPIGAPIVGWIANDFGPRWAGAVGAAAGVVAAFVAIHFLLKHRGLTVRIDGRWVRISLSTKGSAQSQPKNTNADTSFAEDDGV